MSDKGQAYDRGYREGFKKGPVEYRNPFEPGYLADRYKAGFDAGRKERGRYDRKALNSKRRGLI